uniref:Uncharacterized protein n=1 Tax=Anguilla anguilla TaxID=7936 RepID=A0A0E9T067_ANGAN
MYIALFVSVCLMYLTYSVYLSSF